MKKEYIDIPLWEDVVVKLLIGVVDIGCENKIIAGRRIYFSTNSNTGYEGVVQKKLLLGKFAEIIGENDERNKHQNKGYYSHLPMLGGEIESIKFSEFFQFKVENGKKVPVFEMIFKTTDNSIYQASVPVMEIEAHYHLF